MSVLEQLADFIAEAKDRLIANSWLDDDKMQVYVRLGRHLVNKKIIRCLDIASVEVYKQKEGTWTNFIWKAHEMNPWECTYVECVVNPIMTKWLLKNGFTPVDNSLESFYLLKHEKDSNL